MNETTRRGTRSWLNVVPAGGNCTQANEVLDLEANATRDRIWYRGDGNELEQMYQQVPEYADKYKFWTSRCTPGMGMRKIHTDLLGLIACILSVIVLNDMNDFDFVGNDQQQQLWEDIARDNKLVRKLGKVLKEVLYIGDGAFKITVDTTVSEYLILEWYPGERVEIVRNRDRVKGVVFRIPYRSEYQQYALCKYYGYGYTKNELCKDDTPVSLNAIDATEGIKDAMFGDIAMLAVPL